MFKVPAFKAHLLVEVLPGEGVLILSEQNVRALHGSAYEEVVTLIDGQRCADEIVDALAGKVEASLVYYVLGELEAKGYLVEATREANSDETAFWHAAGLDPAAARIHLQNTRVAIHAIGGLDVLPLQRALESAGVRAGSPEGADLWLVMTDDYLRAELAVINAEALQANRPWLLFRATGRELWLGPFFRPGKTGCWECLRQRLDRNRSVHRFIALRKNLSNPPVTARGALPAAQTATCHMVAAFATQFLSGDPAGLEARILCLDWATMRTENHALPRRAHCRACGKPPGNLLKPLMLSPGRATCVSDGGHRSVSPEITLRKYEHLISPMTGVVRQLIPAPENLGPSHVYLAGHNHAMKVARFDHLKKNLRHSSSGKGASEAQAKAGALCEAIERHCGEWTGEEAKVTRAWRDWRNGDAIHPNDVMRFSTRQFAERDAWNKRGSHFNGVPDPLPDEAPVDWTPLWSLTTQSHKYLPTQLLYFGAPAGAEDTARYAIGCSNGNAAGNTMEEAILQGFFELVERDAVALWWYNRLRRPGVALETFGDPYLVQLLDFYRDHYHREAWALDLTSDLGIPVFVAVSRVTNGEQERILVGMGCHLEARIALQRAFGEMNQMMGMAHTGEQGELSIEDRETLDWLRHSTMANQPYVSPDPQQPPKVAADFAGRHSGDFLQDIQLCRSIVENQGMEVLVLDQTRADVRMPVVKVVVPGLRHFWARYGPGRLYDVPVKMNWLERSLREDELNPIPIFF